MSASLSLPELRPTRETRRGPRRGAPRVAVRHTPQPFDATRQHDVLLEALCRALNVAVALIAIVLTSPLMAVLAVLIKVTSPGPVLYRQPRVGCNRRARTGSDERDVGGMIFVIYKFRTMRCDSDSSRQVWATRNDSRITPVGRVLRGFRLDELPQFFNVLRGDMNIVGPRPEQPTIAQELKHKVSRYTERLAVPPGITGLAQVTLAYDQDLEDVRRKVAMDLQYVRARSPLLDLRIMLRTPMVMLLRRGAV